MREAFKESSGAGSSSLRAIKCAGQLGSWSHWADVWAGGKRGSSLTGPGGNSLSTGQEATTGYGLGKQPINVTGGNSSMGLGAAYSATRGFERWQQVFKVRR